MSEIPTYFDDFLPAIGPTKRQREVMAREHRVLRERLMADPTLKSHLIATFIQGSQRRFTANRGSKAHPCDVDVVAVTNMPRSSTTAAHAHHVFRPFLERFYPGRYEAQDRSWCITVDDEVAIDLVPTSEPDSIRLREAVVAKSIRDWDGDLASPTSRAMGAQSVTEAVLADARRDQDFDRHEPLWIPDRTLRVWERTHPLYLIGWTARKNQLTNGHFIHVVRIIKWWRREMQPLPKYPKGYPLEHLVGECCPNGLKSIAAGVATTLEEIASRYASAVGQSSTPLLPARGVPEPVVDVMWRVTGEDFAEFHANVRRAARIARRALEAETTKESATLWRELLGPEFPLPPTQDIRVTGGFTPPSEPARPQEGRFA
jgi:hypothetical protein